MTRIEKAASNVQDLYLGLMGSDRSDIKNDGQPILPRRRQRLEKA